MEIRLNIPDDIAAGLQAGGDLSRRALEALALGAYKSGELTEYQIRTMLGLATRFDVHAFLKSHGVFFEYSPEDLAREAETSRALFASRARE
jgi:Uncharacterised protein family (UPF0175)